MKKEVSGKTYEAETDRRRKEKEGVVATPPEIVNFINESVRHILKTEFGKELEDDGVKIIEPFCGTAPFLSGIAKKMSKEKLKRKIERGEFKGIEINKKACGYAKRNIEIIAGEQISFPFIENKDVFLSGNEE